MLPDETRAQETIGRVGPSAAFQTLIAENDARIRGGDLEHGRRMASARTAIYTALVRDWAEEQQRLFGYNKPFAVVALGGTGRAEMAPWSDNDFAFLFDEALEGNPFLLELQRQVLHSSQFERRCGFQCLALPFSLEDVPRLTGKQLNAFLDMRPVHDPTGLANSFRERIRATYDPFEHFLHVRGFWKDQWEKAAGESERLDRFDIKNDGLRVFLAGIWTLAGKRFIHAWEVYRELDDPRDLQAYDFLLRIRSFVHLKRPAAQRSGAPGSHPQDVLGFNDFVAFGEMAGAEADERTRFEFANAIRARLLSARRRVASFAKGIIERELREGRRVGPGNPIVYGVGGLSHASSAQCHSSREKSRAALSLLLASQRYGVPIDPAELQATFRNAGDWLERVPELSALFYERHGSLADSFAFLSQMAGAEDRLFPGYTNFESSLDGRVMTERKTLRGALERQKIRILEHYVREGLTRLSQAVSSAEPEISGRPVSVEIEAALLDVDHLAAIKLALKTKRLPLTPDDLTARMDDSRPAYERYSSGLSDIPLSEYYAPFAKECEFLPATMQIVEFLVAHRRTFKDLAETGLNDAQQVDEFARLCGEERRLRALFVFTCADRAEWESPEAEPARWFNTRELYAKTLARFRPAADPTHSLRAAGYAPEQLRILRDFGEDFFGGVYRQYANHFGAHLVRLAEQPDSGGPRARILRDSTATIVGVAARDYRGLAATISGALWHHQVDLRQAHLFSAMRHKLALDFFHFAFHERVSLLALARFVEEAIRQRRFIGEADEAALPHIDGRASLREWRQGLHCLRFETREDAGGLVYVLTYKIFRHLGGDIFGLSAHAARGRAYVAVYHRLPRGLSFEEAREIAARHF